MYSMALDNSWLIMNEDEMYDVNGGWGIFSSSWSGKIFEKNWKALSEKLMPKAAGQGIFRNLCTSMKSFATFTAAYLGIGVPLNKFFAKISSISGNPFVIAGGILIAALGVYFGIRYLGKHKVFY